MSDNNKWRCRVEDLKGTKTEENLKEAFAGESQSRNRYTLYSKAAKKEGFIQISEIFLETAENEREHAKLFYKEIPNGAYTPNAIYPFFYGCTYENLTASSNAFAFICSTSSAVCLLTSSHSTIICSLTLIASS